MKDSGKKSSVSRIIKNIHVPGTGKKKIQKELSQSEEKYQRAFNCTGTGMMILDEDMIINTVNSKITEMTGYEASEIEGKRKWTELVSENDLKWMVDFHKQRREEQVATPAEYEFQYTHKSGSLHWAFVNVSIIPGTSQTLVSLIDIQKRREMEDEVVESRERFRETADLLPAFIIESDLKFHIKYANKMALETFQLSEDDVKAGTLSFMEFIHQDDQPRALENAKMKLSGEDMSAQEYKLIDKHGKIRIFLISSTTMIKNEKIIGMRSCLVDVSHQKEIERQLISREEEVRSLFKASPIGIVVFDRNGHIKDCNDSFSSLFSIPENVPFADLDFTLFNDIAEIKKFKEKLKEDSVQFESGYDFKFTNTGGVTEKIELGGRIFEWNITALNKSEDDIQYLGQVQDITARKKENEKRLSDAKKIADNAEKMVAGLKKELYHSSSFNSIVSRSPVMRDIFQMLPEISQALSTVFVHGESGTGKELIAKSIHELSGRKDKPFIAVNCGALPDNLLESELFGYKAGAFTDAKKDKLGKFCLADGGTLFLDEIGDISHAMQVKLLRVLQERVVEPLGGTAPKKVDVRVVAATNKDLSELVSSGEFREDLYYRIKVLTVDLPPLRDRKCDIPLLSEHFISMFNSRYKKNVSELSGDALDTLLAYNYPGNIRELENIIERAMIFCKGAVIEAGHLPTELAGPVKQSASNDLFAGIESLEDLEKVFIIKVIKEEGSKVAAAKRLGMHKATLFRKIKSLGITEV